MSVLPDQPSPLTGREVWLLSTVPYDFALHGRTLHLAHAFRALGARVTFVEPPSPRAALRRLKERLSPARHPVRVVGPPPTLQRVADRLPLVPRLHDRLQGRWLRHLAGDRRPLLLVSTPRWAPALRKLPNAGLFYDCLDDVSVHAEPARLERFLAWEDELLTRADGVAAVTPALAASLRSRGARRVEVVGNGVDVERFLSTSQPPAPKGPARRVGYVGALYEWVDFELLAAAARALPEHEFYLAGPVRRGMDVTALSRLPNVRLPGYVPYAQVPGLMASFDVALIPFREGVVARAADPIKVYEYFCFGTPVVSTEVGDVERLRPLLHLASGPVAFVAAIRRALEERDPALRARRLAYAREHDWTAQARKLAALLAGGGEADRMGS